MEVSASYFSNYHARNMHWWTNGVSTYLYLLCNGGQKWEEGSSFSELSNDCAVLSTTTAWKQLLKWCYGFWFLVRYLKTTVPQFGNRFENFLEVPPLWRSDVDWSNQMTDLGFSHSFDYLTQTESLNCKVNVNNEGSHTFHLTGWKTLLKCMIGVDVQYVSSSTCLERVNLDVT